MTDPSQHQDVPASAGEGAAASASGLGQPLPMAPAGPPAGMPGTPGSPATGVDPAQVEPILDGAALLGLELEPRFRVLAATFELDPDRHPRPDQHPDGEATDRRVQLLCHPVSTMLASLRQRGPEGAVLLEFAEEQLLDVVAAFDGARVSGPLFGQPEPRPGSWGPAFSLQGRSSAADGTRTTLTINVEHDDLSLDLFARFDEVELRDPAGQPLLG